jgi:hypothetical protein
VTRIYLTLRDLQSSSSKLDVQTSEKQSIALVDWSSLNRTCELLSRKSDIADPFVALTDFCTILSACIFYDKVVFIDDNNQLVNKISSVMNLPGVFVSLSINEVGSSLRQLLDAHYSWAFHHFETETWHKAQWLTWLEENWIRLMPGINFPKHSGSSFDTQLGYATSPQRKS